MGYGFIIIFIDVIKILIFEFIDLNSLRIGIIIYGCDLERRILITTSFQ